MAEQPIIQRFAFWNPSTWAIPTLYWDAFSNEQRFHAICKQLSKVIGYSDYLGTNVNDIAERLKAIEEGQLDPLIVAEIEAWFNDNQPAIVQALNDIYDAIPMSDFDSAHTVKDALDANDAAITILENNKLIVVEDYGAIGDGTTDCTQAIQDAIDANPNATINFKGGTYIISDTIFMDGDINGQCLDLNGSIIKWAGADGSAWAEGNATIFKDDSDGIYAFPYVMFAISRRAASGKGTQPTIKNGTLDADYKANICIQNVSYVPVIQGLRIQNFQYAGILNGTLDGATYNNGVQTSTSGLSTQARISDCYFTRGGDMAERFAMAMLFTYPDNQVSNCVTNRTKYAMTMRNGGNSVSNCHFTIQYDTNPALSDYHNGHVRLWPFSAGDTQLNVFNNCYFNCGEYVVYTYHDDNQSFTGANLRTMIANSHYTFYTSNNWGSMFNPVWFGGMWYGLVAITQCTMIYNDYTRMLVTSFPDGIPTERITQNSEISFAQCTWPHVHSRLFDASNYQNNGEPFCFSTSGAGLPAGKYKRIAALVTRDPSAGHYMPGAIRFKFSKESGECAKSGVIIEHSGDYDVNVNSDYGSTTIKCYITNQEITTTLKGETFYISYIYMMCPTSVTEKLYFALSCDSPSVKIYAYPMAYNNDGSESSMNQSIYDSLSDAIEVF